MKIRREDYTIRYIFYTLIITEGKVGEGRQISGLANGKGLHDR